MHKSRFSSSHCLFYAFPLWFLYDIYVTAISNGAVVHIANAVTFKGATWAFNILSECTYPSGVPHATSGLPHRGSTVHSGHGRPHVPSQVGLSSYLTSSVVCGTCAIARIWNTEQLISGLQPELQRYKYLCCALVRIRTSTSRIATPDLYHQAIKGTPTWKVWEVYLHLN